MNDSMLNKLTEDFLTPAYIFNTDEFKARVASVKSILGEKISLCYSIKANPFLINNIPDEFKYVEVCSPGELTICEKSSVDLSKIIYSGVNKGEMDICRALCDNVGIFTAESPHQLELINLNAGNYEKRVDVILRLTNGSQFGMDEQELLRIIKERSSYANVNIIGLHFFTGTQKKKANLIVKELEDLDNFIKRLIQDYQYHPIHIEYGPGLAVEYFNEPYDEKDINLLMEAAPSLKNFAEKYNLTIEMGRFFAATCGTYLTKVVDTKVNCGINYAICDGGMNQLKYYGQTMAMQVPPITILSSEDREKSHWSLCGSLCTTADVLVRKVELPHLRLGDILAFHRSGAYSVTEGISTFLSREIPRVYLYSENSGLSMVRDFYDSSLLNYPETVWRLSLDTNII